MYGPRTSWRGEVGPWMLGMRVAWMLLPLLAVVLVVVAIVIATRGPRVPITPKT
jgi:hypothetical protein